MKRLFGLAVVLVVALAVASSGTMVLAHPTQTTVITNQEMVHDHQGGGYAEESCSHQLSAVVTDVPGCEFTPNHLVGSPGGIILGFYDGYYPTLVRLTGTLQALATHENGEVDFRCTWRVGVLQGCEVVSLIWPAPGQTYDFACRSMLGAVGEWPAACFHGHD